jgi:predicted nucleotidyltransferase
MIYSQKQIEEIIAGVAKKYELASVYLFGSYARNEAREDSDIDFLVDRTDSKIKSLFDLGELYNLLGESLNKQIDIVTTSSLTDADNTNSINALKDNILKERISLYEKQ